MNQILEQTHLRKNTNLLRARDYWFNRARRLGRLGLYLSIVPTILLIISYFPIPGIIDFMDEYRDFVIAGISITLFFVGLKVSQTADEYRGISNEFREVYDLNVLGIPRNPFILPRHTGEPERMKAMLDEGVRKYRDHPKYEAWYEEVFSDNHNANVIACQMDNALYTYHIYKEAARLYWALTIALLAIVVIPALLLRNPSTMLLIFIATFDLLVTFLEAINEIRDQQDTLSGMRDVVLSEEIDLDDDIACGIFIREAQDAIAAYREVSAFVPRFIRLKYLHEDSPYYKDLNVVKARLFKGREMTRPETAEQISTFGEADNITGALADAHGVLRQMLADIIPVWEEGGVRYALDGGSLIGAVRENENHHFVFWDDDIDFTLDVRDVERAKHLVREKLGDRYDVQDFENDPAYAPRLSNFRIRHHGSVVSEKDSVLYENYRFRGIFIDVYAYTPTLSPLTLDRWYRRLMLQPLNAKIERAEWACVEAAPSESREDTPEFVRFLTLKKRMLRRIDWYTAHARNDRVLSYTPNYLYAPKKPGPYLDAAKVWGNAGAASAADLPHAMLEGVECAIPADADHVLSAYYGNWREVPFRTVEQMRATVPPDDPEEEAGKWYSRFVQAITPLKHLRTIDWKE